MNSLVGVNVIVPPAAVAEARADEPTATPVASDAMIANTPTDVPGNPEFGLASHLESQFDAANPLGANPLGLDPLNVNPATVSPQTPGLEAVATPQETVDRDDLEESSGEMTLPSPVIIPEIVPAKVAAKTVTIEDVLISATESFPAIREASLLRSLAIGNQISALGEFDDKIEAFTINQPLGFYENYRHGVGWKKPLTLGGTGYLGYQLGDGSFEPWFGERETNEGGEFKAGFDIPLFQNRAIDPRRTAVRLASLDVQRANPELFQQVLMTQFEATDAYWTWVAASKQYAIAMELMRLAEVRVDQIEKQIQAGDLARIVGIDNRRLLALRREKLIEAKQKHDSSAIKLSLYYRDSLGRPLLLTLDSQPKDFPPLPAASIDVGAEIVRALTNRPELEILGVIEEQIRAELRLAINQRMPEVSFGTEISQDVGGLTSSKGDKQPFKLEAGLIGSVPVQRRKAIGKAQSLRAKLGQIDAKRQLTSDKISNEVRQAMTIYDAAHLRLEQSQITKDLASQTLAAGETSFAEGDIDILLLNIYEQAFADAGIQVINAQADVFTAEAMLIIATGRSLLQNDFSVQSQDTAETIGDEVLQTEPAADAPN